MSCAAKEKRREEKGRGDKGLFVIPMRGLDGSAHLSLLEREGHLLEIASSHVKKRA